jgi:predicted GIY-YIG superfamily endonuclease
MCDTIEDGALKKHDEVGECLEEAASDITDNLSAKTSKPSFVYLLVADGGSTYVGATVDLDHRLRQHNKELVGGAHATSRKVAQGEKWRRHCYVAGFPTWSAALQFEWRWKQISRKMPQRMPPLERRMIALQRLLDMEKATERAIPYKEWPNSPTVVYG